MAVVVILTVLGPSQYESSASAEDRWPHARGQRVGRGVILRCWFRGCTRSLRRRCQGVFIRPRTFLFLLSFGAVWCQAMLFHALARGLKLKSSFAHKRLFVTPQTWPMLTHLDRFGMLSIRQCMDCQTCASQPRTHLWNDSIYGTVLSFL